MLLNHWATPYWEAGLIAFVGLVGGTFCLYVLSLIVGAAWKVLRRKEAIERNQRQ
jgi:hypothetical protein